MLELGDQLRHLALFKDLFVGKLRRYYVTTDSPPLEDFFLIDFEVFGNRSMDDTVRRHGIVFEALPPVLVVHLRRSPDCDDFFEFFETFDAAPHASADTCRLEPTLEYFLFGVFVHDGRIVRNTGYGYAFLRPAVDGPFYKFHDNRVTLATLDDAIGANFGGEKKGRCRVAVMLLYVRVTG
jgi:ubiquitin carboxyl-terminal hydrolase 7